MSARPPAPTPRRVPTWLPLVAFAVAGLVLGLLLPAAPSTRHARGDEQLRQRVVDLLGDRHDVAQLSVATLEGGGEPRFAGFARSGDAPAPDTPFELGSVTKTFTGQLLAVGIERGELALDDPLSKHLPELAGSEVGGVTLRDLATHRSGLPRVAPGTTNPLRAYSGDNPYGRVSAGQLIEGCKQLRLGKRGAELYSNLGVALLGHAEARAAKSASWGDLVSERLWSPLGMSSTTLSVGGSEPAGFARPQWSNGRGVEAWSGEGYQPAGTSTRTTARDLARYAKALLDGSAPGSAAMDKVAEGEKRHRGLLWSIEEHGGRTLTTHNGMTGGSRTVLVLDRERHTASLLLGTGDDGTERVGYALLAGGDRPAAPKVPLVTWVLIGGVVTAVGQLAWSAWRGASAMGVLANVVSLAAMGWATLVVGAWGTLPSWVLTTLAGLALGALVAAGIGLRGKPWLPAQRAALTIASLVANVVLLGVVAAALF